MTELEYEHECKRAELLGIEKPSREEFFSRKPTTDENTEGVDDLNVEVNEEIDRQGEGINRTAGGLDEINNILSITQKKINHLKTVCGSFTGILKLQSHFRKDETGSPAHTASDNQAENCEPNQSMPASAENISAGEAKAAEIKNTMQSDMESTIGVQISKLDSIIMKAEKANLSLSSQNKQMRAILKK